MDSQLLHLPRRAIISASPTRREDLLLQRCLARTGAGLQVSAFGGLPELNRQLAIRG